MELKLKWKTLGKRYKFRISCEDTRTL